MPPNLRTVTESVFQHVSRGLLRQRPWRNTNHTNTRINRKRHRWHPEAMLRDRHSYSQATGSRIPGECSCSDRRVFVCSYRRWMTCRTISTSAGTIGNLGFPLHSPIRVIRVSLPKKQTAFPQLDGRFDQVRDEILCEPGGRWDVIPQSDARGEGR